MSKEPKELFDRQAGLFNDNAQRPDWRVAGMIWSDFSPSFVLGMLVEIMAAAHSDQQEPGFF